MTNPKKTLTAEEILAKYPSAYVVEEFDNTEWVKGVEEGAKIRAKMEEEEFKKNFKFTPVTGRRIGGFSAEEVEDVEKNGISKETEAELRALGVVFED